MTASGISGHNRDPSRQLRHVKDTFYCTPDRGPVTSWSCVSGEALWVNMRTHSSPKFSLIGQIWLESCQIWNRPPTVLITLLCLTLGNMRAHFCAMVGAMCNGRWKWHFEQSFHDSDSWVILPSRYRVCSNHLELRTANTQGWIASTIPFSYSCC